MPTSYTWAFSLWAVRCLAIPLDPIGMPTFFVCLSVNNGDTIRYG